MPEITVAMNHSVRDRNNSIVEEVESEYEYEDDDQGDDLGSEHI